MLLTNLVVFLFEWVLAEQVRVGIINGTDASIADYPWMVSIYDIYDGVICGGSLISPDWVLTSGYCAGLHIKKISVASNQLDDNKTVFVDVSEIFVHPNFTYNADYNPTNDISVLHLNSSVNGSDTSPINLPEPNVPIQEGKSVSITGWGDTTGRGNYTNDLKVVTITIPTIDSCIEAYKKLKFIIDSDIEFCAGAIGDVTGTCLGDSGNPAEINGTLIGIVSWQYQGCSTSKMPVVLVNISKYRHWIYDMTGV